LFFPAKENRCFCLARKTFNRLFALAANRLKSRKTILTFLVLALQYIRIVVAPQRRQ